MFPTDVYILDVAVNTVDDTQDLLQSERSDAVLNLTMRKKNLF